ncbi:MAG TPA: STAS domain-containing protein [Pyrinomonadaceae bacterium]|nr:STAS domain-containing protein [Pyrinomonadaceae bacterium]
MTTRITKISKEDDDRTVLRVEGSLHLADAEVLESTYMDLCEQHSHSIAIDLAGLSFLDSDSASVLCRLKKQGAELIGIHFFVQQILQAAGNC